MIQKVIKVGTSAAITIPKSYLKKLGLSIGQKVETSIKDDTLITKPESKSVITERDKRITELTTKFIDEYRDDLEALA